MDVRELLVDAFGRIAEEYAAVADGLDAARLQHRPAGRGNSIGWLLWHLARVQDDHVADLARTGQVWPAWQQRLGVPFGTESVGYGHSSAEVDQVRIEDASLLTGYFDQVHTATLAYLDTVDAAELDRVVDTRWDPPVTAGVRLVSVVSDCLQHVGQAAYVKGLPADD